MGGSGLLHDVGRETKTPRSDHPHGIIPILAEKVDPKSLRGWATALTNIGRISGRNPHGGERIGWHCDIKGNVAASSGPRH